jgi:CO/xanthine dehydrogenase FAD-binding subunit
MILPRFDVLVPDSLDGACQMLKEYSSRGVRILAGGTDLLVNLRKPIIPQHVPRCDGCARHPAGMVRSTIDCELWDSEPLADAGGPLRSTFQDPQNAGPKFLISLHRLKDLKGIKKLADGALEIGALITITEIERSSEVRRNWEALAEGADNLGSPLVRNRGTLGGNIANARPAADLAVPTIGLGGMLTLRSLDGERSIAAKDFPRAPGVTEIKPDEILAAVTYPAAPLYSGSAYYKLANRKALEISTVGVSVWLALEEPNGRIKDVRIALGAVGPTPIVAGSVKDILTGKIPDEALFKSAAQAAANDARPIDDHRGSAQYRLQMVELLSERLLKIAYERAGKNR